METRYRSVNVGFGSMLYYFFFFLIKTSEILVFNTDQYRVAMHRNWTGFTFCRILKHSWRFTHINFICRNLPSFYGEENFKQLNGKWKESGVDVSMRKWSIHVGNSKISSREIYCYSSLRKFIFLREDSSDLPEPSFILNFYVKRDSRKNVPQSHVRSCEYPRNVSHLVSIGPPVPRNCIRRLRRTSRNSSPNYICRRIDLLGRYIYAMA